MNLHSLISNQFDSFGYRDMIRHAWHSTDPDYSIDELSSGPPVTMVQDVQFNFNPAHRCEFNCTNHAFIKCSHCGELMCLKHFLERKCFHQHHHSVGGDGNEGGSNHTGSASGSGGDSHDDRLDRADTAMMSLRSIKSETNFRIKISGYIMSNISVRETAKKLKLT